MARWRELTLAQRRDRYGRWYEFSWLSARDETFIGCTGRRGVTDDTLLVSSQNDDRDSRWRFRERRRWTDATISRRNDGVRSLSRTFVVIREARGKRATIVVLGIERGVDIQRP